MQNVPFDDDYVKMISDKTQKKYRLNDDEIDYYVFNDVTSNYTYQPGNENIGILYKNGEVKDITQASDHLNINLLSKPTTKYFLCYPKSIV
jgi:hypothetical protein